MYVCVSKWVQGRGPSPTLSPTDPVPRGLLTLWARAGRVYAYMYVCVRAHMCVSADVRAHAHAHAHERAHVCVRVCVCVCHQRVPMAPLHLTLLLPLTCRGILRHLAAGPDRRGPCAPRVVGHLGTRIQQGTALVDVAARAVHLSCACLRCTSLARACGVRALFLSARLPDLAGPSDTGD